MLDEFEFFLPMISTHSYYVDIRFSKVFYVENHIGMLHLLEYFGRILEFVGLNFNFMYSLLDHFF